jgi:hypothetical protein
VHTHRCEKQVPGHHVQVDVKFVTLQRRKGAPVRRYQYTATDDATRVRALKIYRRHTQAPAWGLIAPSAPPLGGLLKAPPPADLT